MKVPSENCECAGDLIPQGQIFVCKNCGKKQTPSRVGRIRREEFIEWTRRTIGCARRRNENGGYSLV